MFKSKNSTGFSRNKIESHSKKPEEKLVAQNNGNFHLNLSEFAELCFRNSLETVLFCYWSVSRNSKITSSLKSSKEIKKIVLHN